MTNLNAIPSLSFNRDLLTDKEAMLVHENWDGGAVLRDDLPETIKVATHDGIEFHADEVLALAMLRVLSGAGIMWVRTRDPKILEEADLRIDVGEGLLDHHGSRAVPGIAACSRVLALLLDSRAQPREVWEALAPVVEATAATDTGVDGSTNINPWVHAAAMGARVRGENPDEAFNKVVDKMTEFVVDIVEAAQAAAKAKAAAEREMNERGDSPVVVFSAASRLADVKKMLWENHRQCVFFVSPESELDWRILCAADPEKPYSPFDSRKLILERFRGLRGEELSKAAGVPGAIFCHAAGFIAGFTSQDAAEQFAKLCLED